MSGSALTVGTTIIGLTINGIGLVFIAIQVVLTRRQLGDNLALAAQEAIRMKRQETIDFYMTTLERVNEWRSVLPDEWDKARITAYTSSIYRRRSKKRMLILASYLGYFEALAVAVRGGIYDLATLDAIAGSRVLNICENYQTFFSLRRKESGSELAYRNLEWLGQEIRNRRNSPGYKHAP